MKNYNGRQVLRQLLENNAFRYLSLILFQFCTSQIEASTSPPPPGHLTPSLAREGGHLITTHRGWGI